MGKLKELLRDLRASYYLKKNSKKKRKMVMKVAFIVFEPESWDKEEPVFEELNARENIQVDLLVVPSFNEGFNVKHGYSKEWEFFSKKYPFAKKVVDNDGEVLDLAKKNYDYIFYQSPYNEHMPKELQSKRLVKYTKICYIPYGFTGSNVFNGGNTNEAFFRNVYFWFGDVPEVRDILVKRFSNNVKEGLQNFLLLGYPAFEKYNIASNPNNKKLRILWTPRWSYHPVIGGSHFIEYKDRFVELSKKYKSINFAIRPHPMMFINFIKENRITNKDKEKYIKKLEKNNIFLSESREINEDCDDSDILITDYSSVIPMFFLTGKPIIYCKSNIELNVTFSEMFEGIYIAENWEEVEKYVADIVIGNDYLKSKRISYIYKLKEFHIGASKRIVNTIIGDFYNRYRK